jgi:hypothetical protein
MEVLAIAAAWCGPLSFLTDQPDGPYSMEGD